MKRLIGWLMTLVALAAVPLVWSPPALAVDSIVIADDLGNTGRDSIMRLDDSGRPTIAYVTTSGISERDLKVIHCGNANCSASNTITTVFVDGAAAGRTSTPTSMEIDSNGNPVIAFTSQPNQSTTRQLKLIHCGNPSCSAGNAVSDVTGLDNGLMTLNGADNPVIVSKVFNDVQVLVCGNPTCSAGNTTTTPFSASISGGPFGLELNSLGRPVIGVANLFNGRTLDVIVCGDTTCTTGNTLETAVVDSFSVDFALRSDGKPVVLHEPFDGIGHISLTRCGSPSCDTGNSVAVVFAANVSGGSLTLDAVGKPVIAIQTTELILVHCSNAVCGGTNSVHVVDAEGYDADMVLDSSGNPVLAYAEAYSQPFTKDRLKVAHCDDPDCDIPQFCGGQLVTIDMRVNGGNGIGTAGNDVIQGTNFADMISGDFGDDTICGDNSSDTIRGGPGSDTIFGGQAGDTILGGGGGDTVHGGDGDDNISGQGGADTLNGDDGDDTINGQGAADIIDGGVGNDTLAGQNGGDSLSGSFGDNTMRGNLGPDTFYGGPADDDMFGGEGADTFFGGTGFDKCAGNTGPDSAEAATCEQTPSIETLF